MTSRELNDEPPALVDAYPLPHGGGHPTASGEPAETNLCRAAGRRP